MKMVFILLLSASSLAFGQTGQWRVVTHGQSGPVVQTDLPDSNGKRRTAFIAIEYARQCDPIFSFIEIQGNSLGSPVSQTVLRGSKIGVILNGKFHTWHAGKISYSNGYEASFGIENELVRQLLAGVSTLIYVTPSGEQIPLNVANLPAALRTGLEFCKKKI